MAVLLLVMIEPHYIFISSNTLQLIVSFFYPSLCALMGGPHSCLLHIINNIKSSDQRGLAQNTNWRAIYGRCQASAGHFVWRAKQLEVRSTPFPFLFSEGNLVRARKEEGFLEAHESDITPNPAFSCVVCFLTPNTIFQSQGISVCLAGLGN